MVEKWETNRLLVIVFQTFNDLAVFLFIFFLTFLPDSSPLSCTTSTDYLREFTLNYSKTSIKRPPSRKWPRGGGGGYSPKFRIGVCRKRSQTLTLPTRIKKTKINTLSKAQTWKLTPYSKGGEALRDDSNNG